MGQPGSYRDNSNMLYGLKDSSGKIITPGKYKYPPIFKEERGIVQIGYQYGIIDYQGKEIVPAQYDLINIYSEGWAKARNNGQKPFFFDKQGKVIQFDADFDDCEIVVENLILIKKNNLWGVMNRQGKIITPCQYPALKTFSEGMAAFSKNATLKSSGYDGQWGFIDSTGKEVIPAQFGQVHILGFRNGFCSVSNDMASENISGLTKWGYIDRSGKMVIPMQYHQASSFSEEIALVNIGKDKAGFGGQWGFINKKGQPIFPMINCAIIYGEGKFFRTSGYAIVVVKSPPMQPADQYYINIKGERIKKPN
jgi:hypothetical protein